MLKIAIIIGSTRPGRNGEASPIGFTKSRKGVAMPSLKWWTSKISTYRSSMSRCRR